ncbi:hypothetical protein COP2_001505 [Malus domestica]
MGFHVPSLCSVRSVYLFVTTLLFVMNLSSANPFGNKTDRLALLRFKESISADPLGFLTHGMTPFISGTGMELLAAEGIRESQP